MKRTDQNEYFDKVDANFYSINNDYLTQFQKVEVMFWYSLPGNLMHYVFMGLAVYSIFQPLWWAWFLVIPLLVNIIVGILNWYFYYRPISMLYQFPKVRLQIMPQE